MDKEGIVYLYNGLLSNPSIFSNIDGLWQHYIKWNNIDNTNIDGIIYKWNLKRKSHTHRNRVNQWFLGAEVRGNRGILETVQTFNCKINSEALMYVNYIWQHHLYNWSWLKVEPNILIHTEKEINIWGDGCANKPVGRKLFTIK